jgi:hypothetical protein
MRRRELRWRVLGPAKVLRSSRPRPIGTAVTRAATPVERDEHAAWMARDPIEGLRRRLIGDFALDVARLDEIEAKAQARVEAAVEFARQSPEPSPESGLEHVFI